MDSLSQIALGSAVGVAVLGRHAPVWKAALVGAVYGTLPDLDVLLDFGDPIANMTRHRAESHAIPWLTLVSPALTWIAMKALREPMAQFKSWWLAVWLILITHPLLDWTTIYGTQLWRPFSDQPFGLGSMFIIDPLYTLPLLIALGFAFGKPPRARIYATLGLAISTAYLVWSAVAQQIVRGAAQDELRRQGIVAEHLLVTPTAFNTILWRVVAVSGDSYYEGFRSLLDKTPAIAFDRFPRRNDLLPMLGYNTPAASLAWFTQGFYKLAEQDSRVIITDLRMGQEPLYTFNFVVAQRQGDRLLPTSPERNSFRVPLREGLAWLWPRLLGEPLPPPRGPFNPN
ncbi:metal-dependent hydrolase [Ferrovibrio sp.]|uniref:metal-dependent hydrolase n=1 Tax=Ferrovibrio sp. TaxID=1917215 RepID=UPI0025BF4A89|nr:metal-dependent hydrolase [Ferrovibrio sp.]MBX3456223.1 metal-dependent hydrolase [Ferrovibrio sp.]